MAPSVARHHPGLTLAAATVALVSAALLVCPAGAFVRLMGNSYNYCDSEGSFCLYDKDCCSGLVCSLGFKRMGGGICRRQSQQQQQQQQPPAMRMSADTTCQADADCPASQCCVRRVIGVRGASISSCQADCSSREADRILDDFYSRYYRRAVRSGGHHHGGEEEAEEEHEDKKKKKRLAKKSQH